MKWRYAKNKLKIGKDKADGWLAIQVQNGLAERYESETDGKRKQRCSGEFIDQSGRSFPSFLAFFPNGPGKSDWPKSFLSYLVSGVMSEGKATSQSKLMLSEFSIDFRCTAL